MPATFQKPTHSGAGTLPDESPASGSENVPWETPQRPAYPEDEDRNPVGSLTLPRNLKRQMSATSRRGKPHRNTIQPSRKACKQSERFPPSHWTAEAFCLGGFDCQFPEARISFGTRMPIKGCATAA